MKIYPLKKELPRCPQCGKEPELRPVMYGRVKYAICSNCSWYGDTIDMEISAENALQHWSNKVWDTDKRALCVSDCPDWTSQQPEQGGGVKMQIDDIKQMSRQHLEDLVEYIIRQNETHINVAPRGSDRAKKTAWVRGFDYSRARLIEIAEDHELLKSRLPEKNKGGRAVGKLADMIKSIRCYHDMDAAVARADALEAENARLEAENTKLIDENFKLSVNALKNADLEREKAESLKALRDLYIATANTPTSHSALINARAVLAKLYDELANGGEGWG